MGWVGCCSDDAPGGASKNPARSLLSEGFGPNILWMQEIDDALTSREVSTDLSTRPSGRSSTVTCARKLIAAFSVAAPS